MKDSKVVSIHLQPFFSLSTHFLLLFYPLDAFFKVSEFLVLEKVADYIISRQPF